MLTSSPTNLKKKQDPEGCVHLQVERQTDQLRQSHRQVQLCPGGAEPGQRSSTHRAQTEAERQDGRRPEPSRRVGPLDRCNTQFEKNLFTN